MNTAIIDRYEEKSYGRRYFRKRHYSDTLGVEMIMFAEKRAC